MRRRIVPVHVRSTLLEQLDRAVLLAVDQVHVDTIASVIEAWGRGEIGLEMVDPKTNKGAIQYAAAGAAAYTVEGAIRRSRCCGESHLQLA